MKYLLIAIAFIFSGCSIDGPNTGGVNITLPATYVEWEYVHPQDTTWWTFTADGKCYAAWKRKITEVSGLPAWQPHCMATDRNGNCAAWQHDQYGNVVDGNGRTEYEYNAIIKAMTEGFLPVTYYAGTWGESGGSLLTLAVNQVVPGSYGMNNCTYVTSLYSPAYVTFDFWNDDSLHGYQCDENENRITLQHSDPDVKFSRWHGKGLDDPTSSIFSE